MEELIKQIEGIKLQIQSEKEMSRAELEERTRVLRVYAASLENVLKLADVVASRMQGELNTLHSEVAKETQLLSATKVEHSRILSSHALDVTSETQKLEGLKTHVTDHENKVTHLSKVNEGLTEERRQLEEQNVALRGQNSALDRRRAHAEEDTKTIEKKVNDLLKQETELTSSIESKKKDFTRLSTDVAILEKRAKS